MSYHSQLSMNRNEALWFADFILSEAIDRMNVLNKPGRIGVSGRITNERELRINR